MDGNRNTLSLVTTMVIRSLEMVASTFILMSHIRVTNIRKRIMRFNLIIMKGSKQMIVTEPYGFVAGMELVRTYFLLGEEA